MPNPFTTIIQFHSLTLVLLLLSTAAATDNHHHRRILHQPLYPLESTISPALPPAYSPQYPHFPQQRQPKLPFSATPQRPFFPNFPSPPPPPPPPPPFLATFPANISSLLFPQSPSNTSSSRHHILLTISLSVSLLSAALLISLAAFLFLYRKNHRHGAFSPPASPRKASQSTDTARLFPPNTAPSTPKTRNSSNHSRNSPDFLYLGTLSNTQRSNDDASSTNSSSVGSKLNNPGLSSASAYHKIGSPELNPLPPLPRHNFLSRNRNAEEEEEEDGDEEEFFSPRGSSGRKESQSVTPEHVHAHAHAHAHVLSSSRREFSGAVGVGVDPYGSRSFNSRTASYPYSNSISPSRSSVSNTASPPLNLSPRSLKSSSPDTILKFPAPSQLPRANIPLLRSQPSASTSASEKDIEEEENEEKMKPSPWVRIMPKRIPPPPPPVPPFRFWENPASVVDPPRVMQNQNTGPPVLSVPSIPKGLHSNGSSGEKSEVTTPNSKPKLKPLHWDKVRASSDRAMVWDQLKSSSFQLNEEMIETLFMVNGSSVPSKDNHNRRPSMPVVNQENRVLDPRKSQNVAILLRALNVTVDEVCEALLEGNADSLGSELLESLLKMAPSKEEEYKLKEFKDESPFKLGPAEKFLRAVLDIPFAFKRVDAMLYVANFDAEIEYLKRSFETLQVACAELKNSKMLLKLLEAVLKTGNRMNVGTNRGDAHAFKLDTLLKLVDVKGTDGKTTLLHFVVQEIVRAEGSRILGDEESSQRTQQFALQSELEFRKLGLQVVSSLGGELTNVKKAATMDSRVLSNEVSKLGEGVAKITDVIKLTNETVLTESGRKFLESMIDFLSKAEREITGIQSLERAALSTVREITEYFHGDSAKEEAHPFRIFTVVRLFLSTLDQVCKEVGKINERTIYGSARSIPANPTLPPIFPIFTERKQSDSPGYES